MFDEDSRLVSSKRICSKLVIAEVIESLLPDAYCWCTVLLRMLLDAYSVQLETERDFRYCTKAIVDKLHYWDSVNVTSPLFVLIFVCRFIFSVRRDAITWPVCSATPTSVTAAESATDTWGVLCSTFFILAALSAHLFSPISSFASFCQQIFWGPHIQPQCVWLQVSLSPR